MHGQARPLKGLPQRIAVGSRRLQRHDQNPTTTHHAQQLRQSSDIKRIPHSPRPIKIIGAPPQNAENALLADIQPRMHYCLGAPLQQLRMLDSIDIHCPICFALHGDDLLYVDPVLLTEH